MTARRAFTLIELIVVIVILGVLAALAVPSFRGTSEQSKDQVSLSSANAFDRLVRANGAFTRSSGGSAADVSAAIASSQASVRFHFADALGALTTVSGGTAVAVGTGSGQLSVSPPIRALMLEQGQRLTCYTFPARPTERSLIEGAVPVPASAPVTSAWTASGPAGPGTRTATGCANVGAMQFVPENRAGNPGMEAGTSSWANGGGVGAVLSSVTSPVRSGSRSLRAAAAAAGLYTWNGAGFAVGAGETWTFSLWVFSPQGQPAQNPQLRVWGDPSGSTYGTVAAQAPGCADVVGRWCHMVATGTTSAAGVLQYGVQGTSTAAGQHLIVDEAQMERRAFATPFSG